MAQEAADTSVHDKGLPFFTTDEADHFRSLVKADVTKYGKTLTFLDDHMTSSDGGTYGFWNVAQDCHNNPRRLWPTIIGEHFASLAFDPKGDLFAGLSVAQVKRKLFLRLWADEHPWLAFPYTRLLAPGLREVIGFHHQSRTIVMRQEDVERFGGAEVLRPVAEGNLRALALDRRDSREVAEGPHGGSFRVLSGPSSCTASRLLTVDRLVSLLYVDAEMPFGVLAAAPNRHEVAVHVIQHEDAAAETLVALAIFAARGVTSEPGPLTPHVYWVTPDRFEEVVHQGPAGPDFTASPEFIQMMDALAIARREPGTVHLGGPPSSPPAGRNGNRATRRANRTGRRPAGP